MVTESVSVFVASPIRRLQAFWKLIAVRAEFEHYNCKRSRRALEYLSSNILSSIWSVHLADAGDTEV